MATDTASASEIRGSARRRPESVPEEVTGRAGRPRILAGAGVTHFERPGVAPDGWSRGAVLAEAAASETKPEPGKPEKPDPEVVVEVAPEAAPPEAWPEPEKPDYGPIVEIAPEIATPPETEPEPDKPEKPGYGPIVEIAPEVAPSETEPKSDRPRPEVIVEIAPDLPRKESDDDE